jgi:uncharacterized protein
VDDTSHRSPAAREAGPSRDISIELDLDRLGAYVTVRVGPVANEADLRRALEDAGVIAGIDEVAVAQVALGLLDPAFEIRRAPLARAREARAGEAGRFEPYFLDGLQPGHVREDGTFDFHDRELLKPVGAGEAIGRVWPARPGVSGQRVDGSSIEAERVPEATLTLGPGAQRADDGLVRATRSGVVHYEPARAIDVIEHHVHEADVDRHSGSLHTLGSLVVKGDVHNTFGVYASGDIEVRGSVDNGSVHGGGNVWIHHGVRGAAGTACAEGNLVAQHAESAALYAGRILQVGEALHARLSAGRVEVTGKLRGGVTSAELSAVVGEAGSTQARSTEIAVAQPLELPIEAAKRQLERAKVVRGKRLVGSVPRGGGDLRGKGGKAGRLEAGLQDAETRRLMQRARRRYELSAVAFVDVRLAYAGVTICIGDQKLFLDQDTRASRFTLDLETRKIRAARIRP